MAQRTAKRQFLLASLLFLLLALVPLWPMLRGEVFVPAGLQKNLRPWLADQPQPWDVLRWDSVAQFYPWRKYLSAKLAEGDIPLWNPHELMGTPFLANSQSAAFYPAHWALAPLGVNWLINGSALLHVVWAGLGLYVLCRRLGCGFGAAVVAGMTFELCQWMMAWMQLPSLPMTAAWIPWVLAAAHRVGAMPDFAGAARLTLCAGMMLLAGHLQIATYGLLAGCAYVLCLAVAGRRATILGWGAMGLVGAFGLAAAQFLPTYELGKLSHRANSPTEIGYGFYVRLAMPADTLGLALNPYAMGDPNKGYAPAEDGYQGVEPLPEYACFVGILPLVAFLVPATYRRGGFFVGLWAFAWLLALGTVANKLLYFGIPGWSSTGSPARALCLCSVAASALLGIMLSTLREGPWRRRILLGSAVAQLAILGPFALRFGLWSTPADVYPAFAGLDLLREASPYRVAVINELWGRKEAPALGLLPPNAALAYGFDEVAGYDSIILKSTKEAVLDRLNGGDSAPVENGNMMFLKPPALQNTDLLATGVRYVVIPGTLHDPGPLRLAVEGQGLAIYEYSSLPPLAALRAFDGRMWGCELEWIGANSATIRPPADARAGRFQVAIPAAPGWKVVGSAGRIAPGLPGRPFLEGDAMRAGALLSLRYEPDSYRVGLFLALLTLSVCFGCAVAQLPRLQRVP